MKNGQTSLEDLVQVKEFESSVECYTTYTKRKLIRKKIRTKDFYNYLQVKFYHSKAWTELTPTPQEHVGFIMSFFVLP